MTSEYAVPPLTKKTISLKLALIYAVFGLAAAIFIYPLFYTLLTSLKTNAEIFTNYFGFPSKPQFANYYNALTKGRIGLYFFNSAFVVCIYVVLGLLFSTMASFMLARINLKPLKAVYLFFMAGMMIPIQSILVPVAKMSAQYKLSDSYVFLIGIYLAGGLPFMIFVTTGFMKTLPKSLEEAAVIDGAGLMYIYLNVILPLSKPVIATMGILAFISCWNDLILALILIKKQTMNTVSLGLMNFTGQYTTDFAGLCAAIIIANIPTILVYIFLQEYVEKGLTAGAVKG